MATTAPADLREAVTASAAKVREATAKRDAAIYAMREDGATLREIGEASGLAHTDVAIILLVAMDAGLAC
jgi:hypothetical protein